MQYIGYGYLISKILCTCFGVWHPVPVFFWLLVTPHFCSMSTSPNGNQFGTTGLMSHSSNVWKLNKHCSWTTTFLLGKHLSGSKSYLFRRVLTLHPSQRVWKPPPGEPATLAEVPKTIYFCEVLAARPCKNRRFICMGGKIVEYPSKQFEKMAKMGHLLQSESQFAGLKTTT